MDNFQENMMRWTYGILEMAVLTNEHFTDGEKNVHLSSAICQGHMQGIATLNT